MLYSIRYTVYIQYGRNLVQGAATTATASASATIRRGLGVGFTFLRGLASLGGRRFAPYCGFNKSYIIYGIFFFSRSKNYFFVG